MQGSSKIPISRSARTAWFLSHGVTLGGYEYVGPTSETAFVAGVSGVLARMWAMLEAAQQREGTVIVGQPTAYALGLLSDSPGDALQNARASGWKTSAKVGMWTTFYGDDRPSIYIGQLDRILSDADDDPGRWPWAADFLPDTVAMLQHWHDKTGITWQATPAVMGIELMHRHLPAYRIPGQKGVHRAAKTDRTTPAEAGEAVWTPSMWRRPMADVAAELDRPDTVYIHQYDKTRAGLTAAGVAKLSPTQLHRTGRLPFDPKRAGWWLVSVPPWNEKRLPHPCGPGSEIWARKWVCTATMDLLAELAAAGEVDMPETIDSLTGLARPLLLPWVKVLEEAYDAPLSPDNFGDDDQGQAREAMRAGVKEVATRGVGMLTHTITDAAGKTIPGSTIYRPDWFHAVAATKRSNGWRMAYKIGKGEGRWPVAIDDDCLWYASADADPYAAAPASLSEQIGNGRRRKLDGDQPGDYRVQTSVTATKRVTA